MHKSLVVLAIIGTMSVPAAAQVAPATTNQVQPAKPQTVKKVICERIDVEETTGSRLGSAPKRCRTVEVPAPKAKGSAHQGQHAPAPSNLGGNSL